MCFSAQASFTAASVLTIIGALALSKAQTNEMRFFATTPLIFALQQMLEGFIWMTLNANNSMSYLHITSMYGYIFFASLFWPIWIPWTLYTLEPNRKRKKILIGTIATGVLFAIIAALLLAFTKIHASIVNHHIAYSFLLEPLRIIPDLYRPYAELGMRMAYVVATVGALFISSIPRMWMLGFVIGISYLVSYFYFQEAFGSIWCYFAAISSLLVLYIIHCYKKLYQA